MAKLEVCINKEWIGEHVLDTGMVDSSDRDDATAQWLTQVRDKLEDMGHETVAAKGQRALLHGWNGANTFKRKGYGLGTFAEISDAEWDKITDAAIEAADKVNQEFAEQAD